MMRWGELAKEGKVRATGLKHKGTFLCVFDECVCLSDPWIAGRYRDEVRELCE